MLQVFQLASWLKCTYYLSDYWIWDEIVLKPKSFKVVLLFSIILMMGCSNIGNTHILAIDSYLFPTPSETTTISPIALHAITNTPIYSPATIISTPTYTASATHTRIPTNTPIPTCTPAPTDTPNPTDTSVPTETLTFGWNPAGDVITPILLYHHVSDDGYGNRYFVSLDDFRAQMEALRDWGYTTITASYLAEVIINGGELPNRPVVITFDDGYAGVYQNAFPIISEMGFVGVIYIYVDHVGSNGFVNTEQIRTLANGGWEIGNHSMSHADLTLNHSSIDFEVEQSRLTLEDSTGIKVETFAYPYGKVDDFVIGMIHDFGYLAAMGIGLNYEHTSDTLYNLNRIEIQSDYDLSTFARLLPWSGY
jgi:peptidoglycan/xylan/chitin deacetylase (PgdA/CDA1 family)